MTTHGVENSAGRDPRFFERTSRSLGSASLGCVVDGQNPDNFRNAGVFLVGLLESAGINQRYVRLFAREQN